MMILAPRVLSICHILSLAVSIISATPIPQGTSLRTLSKGDVDDLILEVPMVKGDILDPLPQFADYKYIKEAELWERTSDENENKPTEGDSSYNAGKPRAKDSNHHAINDFLLAISGHPENTKNRKELLAEFKSGRMWKYKVMHQAAARLGIDSSKLPDPLPRQDRTNIYNRNLRIRKDFITKAEEHMKGENPDITREEVEGQFKKENSLRWDNDKIRQYATENSITLSGTLED